MKLINNTNDTKIFALGGLGEVGKNMYCIMTGNELIITDVGITFPSDDMPGIDYIIPDFSFLNAYISQVKVKGVIDYVLTFEELQGMFEAKNVDFTTIEETDVLNEGTGAGRGFAVAGGVAKAVTDLAQAQNPGLEIKTARAEGLRDCRKLMTLAKAGKYNGYLLEGMACPGGCVAGAGTILNVDKAQKNVAKYMAEAKTQSPLESPYHDIGEKLD